MWQALKIGCGQKFLNIITGMYAAWLGKYGLSQTGVSVTNTNMMEELGLENTTKENRKWVSNKFRRANPRCSHYCEDTYLGIYEATSKTTDVDKKREEQSQVVDASQAVLHNLLALLTNETLTPDFFDRYLKCRYLEVSN